MKRRITLILALLAGGALAGVFAATSPAAATTMRVGAGDKAQSILENKRTALCIDDSARGLRAITCHFGDNYQLWNLIGHGGIRYALQNAQTHNCIDDSHAFGLRAIGCNNGIYQDWSLEPAGNGYFYAQNVGTNWCLDDSNSFGLRAVGCNHTTFQQWN
ncbi:MAG TPA: RICIN domain-containing protein [Streptosporangiaceae bacterium]|nr:RICIN domain-containing protein [Streptosporangiaceae bacterium]